MAVDYLTVLRYLGVLTEILTLAPTKEGRTEYAIQRLQDRYGFTEDEAVTFVTLFNRLWKKILRK